MIHKRNNIFLIFKKVDCNIFNTFLNHVKINFDFF